MDSDSSRQAENILRHATDELVLIDKFVGDEVTGDLSILLKRDVNVQRITLRGNCIGTQGAMALAGMLAENTTVTSLSLEWNQVGSGGAQALAAALAKNRTLTHLDLRNNGVGDEGAASLASALRLNQTMSSLDLRWNVVGDKGALTFEEIVSRSEPPITVQFGGNLMSAGIVGRLEGLEERRNELKEMQEYNPMQEADAHAARAKSVILSKDVSDLQQHLELAKAQREELQRQLNASALQVTELEQQVLREQFKARQCSDDLNAAKQRISELADEQRVLTASWESERQEITEEVKRIVREKEVEFRAVSTSRDGLQDRCRNAEEETKRITFQMEQLTDRAEAKKAELMNDIRELMAKNTEFSAQKAAIEHDNKYLKEVVERTSDQRNALEKELAQFRTDATRKLKEEVMRAESEQARMRTEHKAELAQLSELTTVQGKEIATLSGELADANAKMASLQVESSLDRDRAVTAARETEQLRSSSTIADLQTKLESFMQFRSELEARCQGYLKDLQDTRESSSRQIASVTEQQQFTASENERLRTTVKECEDRMIALSTERNSFESDLRDKTAALDEIESNSRKWHRSSEEYAAKNQKLEENVASLRKQVKEFQTMRSDEFHRMQNRVSEVVRKEFELLGVSLQVENAGNHSAPSTPNKQQL